MNDYLITGINGYLGRNLAKHISERGDNVIGVLRLGSNLLPELEDYVERVIYYAPWGEFVNKDEKPCVDWKFDGIFHLAALYSTKTDLATEKELMLSNLKFTSDLIAKNNEFTEETPIVFTSTFSAYTENFELAENNLYSYTKYMGEMLLKNHARYSAVLIMSDTFGPGDYRNKIHDLLLDGKVTELHSPGNQEMVLNHIEDVARALVAVMDNLEKNEFNSSYSFARYDMMYDENRVTLDELIEYLGVDAVCLGKVPRVPVLKGVNKIPNFKLRHSVKDIRDLLGGV